MKYLALSALVLPLGLALTSSDALASRSFRYPGAVCQPVQGSAGCVEYSQYGVHNTCGSTATVECALPIDTTTSTIINVDYWSLALYDRNTSTNVSCTLNKVYIDGSIQYTTTLTSSGSSASNIYLTVGPGLAQNGNYTWRARCTIPAVQSGNFSHIVMTQLLTTE